MAYNDVSIVIPTFNRADFLVQCIDSCIAQTHPCEIIVCDHGSTDDTPTVVKKYGDRITYIRRELDSGVHFCWLDGILHAKNELIHLNFDDDWIEPTFIEKTVALFDDNVGCVLSNAKFYMQNKGAFEGRAFYFDMSTGKYNSNMLGQLNLDTLTSPCAGIYRKKIMLDCLFQGDIPFSRRHYRGVGPDILFSLFSCKKYGQFGYVNEDLAIFRAHDSSITMDALKDKEKTARIDAAYDDARIYFYICKLVDKLRLYTVAKKILTKKQKK